MSWEWQVLAAPPGAMEPLTDDGGGHATLETTAAGTYRVGVRVARADGVESCVDQPIDLVASPEGSRFEMSWTGPGAPDLHIRIVEDPASLPGWFGPLDCWPGHPADYPAAGMTSTCEVEPVGQRLQIARVIYAGADHGVAVHRGLDGQGGESLVSFRYFHAANIPGVAEPTYARYDVPLREGQRWRVGALLGAHTFEPSIVHDGSGDPVIQDVP